MSNKTYDSDLVARSLPEALGCGDLPIINEALAALFTDLRYASTLYQNKDFSDRAATLVALEAGWRFLMRFQPARDEQLHLPLINLSSALMALNNNSVATILRPTPTPKGGRAPDAPDRHALIGIVVGTVGRLLWTGMPVREAHKVVAAELLRLGTRPGRGTGRMTARTVKQWYDRVSADRPAMCSILAGGSEALKKAQPADLARIVAVLNANMMLSPEWKSRLDGRPRDDARRFILSSLRESIERRVVSGNAPGPL